MSTDSDSNSDFQNKIDFAQIKAGKRAKSFKYRAKKKFNNKKSSVSIDLNLEDVNPQSQENLNLDEPIEIYSNHNSSSNSTKDNSFDIFDNSENKNSFYYESSPQDSGDEHNVNDTDLLYNGSNISIAEFILAFKSLKIKHKLADAVSNDLLRFIKIILPASNKCPKSLTSHDKNIFNEHSGNF